MKNGIVLITGASGAIAQQLGALLNLNNYFVRYLTTNQTKIDGLEYFFWQPEASIIDSKALLNVTHIIHLAGYSLNNNWSNKNKLKMYNSRVKSGELLYNTCKQLNIVPKKIISASAIGYYGFTPSSQPKKEQDKAGNYWLSKLCLDWEKSALQFNTIGTKSTVLRFPIVLDKNSGLLANLVPIFKLGLGTYFGNGDAKMPWIHISDLVHFILFSLQSSTEDVINVTADGNTTNKSFTNAILSILNKSKVFPPIPPYGLKLLLGEKAKLILATPPIDNSLFVSSGYQLEYPTIYSALQNLLANGSQKVFS